MSDHQGRGTQIIRALSVVALGALAMLALPAIGIGKGSESDRASHAAGKVESFDRQTGLLVVDLFKGRKIAGYVVRHRTALRCPDERRRHRLRRHRRGVAATSEAAPLGDRSRGAETPTGVRDAGGEPPQRDAPETDPDGGEVGDGLAGPADHRRCLRHLVPGAVVLRAEMVLAYGDAFFRRIALLPPPAVATSAP